jgi:hypothetical protein
MIKAADGCDGSASAVEGTLTVAGVASLENGGRPSTRVRIAFPPMPTRSADRVAPTYIRLGVAATQLISKSANPRPAGKSKRASL